MVPFWALMLCLKMLVYAATKSISIRRGASTWFWSYLLSEICLFPLSLGDTWRVIRFLPGAAWLLDNVKIKGKHLNPGLGDSLIFFSSTLLL